jgi:nucleoside-diphosphate-sugar epimerase
MGRLRGAHDPNRYDVKVLVTGGAGFKGCVIVEALLRAGHEVTTFDLLQYGEGPAIGLQRLGARVVRGDVTQTNSLRDEVAGHDAVIHLAALVGFPLCDADPLRAEAVNVGGTRNVADALQPGQRLIYASTGSIYGRIDDICTEDVAPSPLTRYGRTKLEGERIALMSGGVALRFATVVGVSPCMRFDLMINAFVYRAIHFGWLDLYRSEDRRSFIDVDDAAAAYVFALDNYEAMAGQAFNLGNPDLNLTKRQVADEVSRHFPLRIHCTDTHTDPDKRNYDVAFGRISALGYKATIPLGQSIEQVGRIARMVIDAQQWRFVP